jgi:hypothetical protein
VYQSRNEPSNYNIDIYQDNDINDYIEILINHELEGFQDGCLYLLKKTFPEKNTLYHVVLTQAIDTCNLALPIEYCFNKAVQQENRLAYFLKKILPYFDVLKNSSKQLSEILTGENFDADCLNVIERTLQRTQNITELQNIIEDLNNKDLRDIFDEIGPLLKKDQAAIKILFPCNSIERFHWLTAEIILIKNQPNYSIQMFVHDPYGGGKMQEKMYLQILKAMQKRIIDLDPGANIQFANCPSIFLKGRQEPLDSLSCGVVVAEEIIQRTLGFSLDRDQPYANFARDLRKKHLELKQKYNTQVPAGPPNKPIEATPVQPGIEPIFTHEGEMLKLAPQLLIYFYETKKRIYSLKMAMAAEKKSSATNSIYSCIYQLFVQFRNNLKKESATNSNIITINQLFANFYFTLAIKIYQYYVQQAKDQQIKLNKKVLHQVLEYLDKASLHTLPNMAVAKSVLDFKNQLEKLVRKPRKIAPFDSLTRIVEAECLLTTARQTLKPWELIKALYSLSAFYQIANEPGLSLHYAQTTYRFLCKNYLVFLNPLSEKKEPEVIPETPYAVSVDGQDIFSVSAPSYLPVTDEKPEKAQQFFREIYEDSELLNTFRQECFTLLNNVYGHLHEQLLFGKTDTGIIQSVRLVDEFSWLKKIQNLTEFGTYFKQQFHAKDEAQLKKVLALILAMKTQKIDVLVDLTYNLLSQFCFYIIDLRLTNIELLENYEKAIYNGFSRYKVIQERTAKTTSFVRDLQTILDSFLLATNTYIEKINHCRSLYQLVKNTQLLKGVKILESNLDYLFHKSTASHQSYIDEHIQKIVQILQAYLNPYEFLHEKSEQGHEIFEVKTVVATSKQIIQALKDQFPQDWANKEIRIIAEKMLYYDEDFNQPEFSSVNLVLIAPLHKLKNGICHVVTDGKPIPISSFQSRAEDGKDGTGQEKAGLSGAAGVNGIYGSPGGNICIIGQGLKVKQFLCSALGSAGSKGQDGGIGGRGYMGKNGKNGEADESGYCENFGFSDWYGWLSVSHGEPGSVGGVGGNAGAGGASGLGGRSGKIEYLDLDDSQNSQTYASDHGENGAPGKPGKPGRGGIHGKPGFDHYFFHDPAFFPFVKSKTKSCKGLLRHKDVDRTRRSYRLEERFAEKYDSCSVILSERDAYFTGHPGEARQGKEANLQVNHVRAKELNAIDKHHCFTRLSVHRQKASQHWNASIYNTMLEKLAKNLQLEDEFEIVAPQLRSQLIKQNSVLWINSISKITQESLMERNSRQNLQEKKVCLKDHEAAISPDPKSSSYILSKQSEFQELELCITAAIKTDSAALKKQLRSLKGQPVNQLHAILEAFPRESNLQILLTTTSLSSAFIEYLIGEPKNWPAFTKLLACLESFKRDSGVDLVIKKLNIGRLIVFTYWEISPGKKAECQRKFHSYYATLLSKLAQIMDHQAMEEFYKNALNDGALCQFFDEQLFDKLDGYSLFKNSIAQFNEFPSLLHLQNIGNTYAKFFIETPIPLQRLVSHKVDFDNFFMILKKNMAILSQQNAEFLPKNLYLNLPIVNLSLPNQENRLPDKEKTIKDCYQFYRQELLRPFHLFDLYYIHYVLILFDTKKKSAQYDYLQGITDGKYVQTAICDIKSATEAFESLANFTTAFTLLESCFRDKEKSIDLTIRIFQPIFKELRSRRMSLQQLSRLIDVLNEISAKPQDQIKFAALKNLAYMEYYRLIFAPELPTEQEKTALYLIKEKMQGLKNSMLSLDHPRPNYDVLVELFTHEREKSNDYLRSVIKNINALGGYAKQLLPILASKARILSILEANVWLKEWKVIQKLYQSDFSAYFHPLMEVNNRFELSISLESDGVNPKEIMQFAHENILLLYASNDGAIDLYRKKNLTLLKSKLEWNTADLKIMRQKILKNKLSDLEKNYLLSCFCLKIHYPHMEKILLPLLLAKFELLKQIPQIIDQISRLITIERMQQIQVLWDQSLDCYNSFSHYLESTPFQPIRENPDLEIYYDHLKKMLYDFFPVILDQKFNNRIISKSLLKSLSTIIIDCLIPDHVQIEASATLIAIPGSPINQLQKQILINGELVVNDINDGLCLVTIDKETRHIKRQESILFQTRNKKLDEIIAEASKDESLIIILGDNRHWPKEIECGVALSNENILISYPADQNYWAGTAQHALHIRGPLIFDGNDNSLEKILSMFRPLWDSLEPYQPYFDYFPDLQDCFTNILERYSTLTEKNVQTIALQLEKELLKNIFSIIHAALKERRESENLLLLCQDIENTEFSDSEKSPELLDDSLFLASMIIKNILEQPSSDEENFSHYLKLLLTQIRKNNVQTMLPLMLFIEELTQERIFWQQILQVIFQKPAKLFSSNQWLLRTTMVLYWLKNDYLPLTSFSSSDQIITYEEIPLQDLVELKKGLDQLMEALANLPEPSAQVSLLIQWQTKKNADNLKARIQTLESTVLFDAVVEYCHKSKASKTASNLVFAKNTIPDFVINFNQYLVPFTQFNNEKKKIKLDQKLMDLYLKNQLITHLQPRQSAVIKLFIEKLEPELARSVISCLTTEILYSNIHLDNLQIDFDYIVILEEITKALEQGELQGKALLQMIHLIYTIPDLNDLTQIILETPTAAWLKNLYLRAFSEFYTEIYKGKPPEDIKNLLSKLPITLIRLLHDTLEENRHHIEPLIEKKQLHNILFGLSHLTPNISTIPLFKTTSVREWDRILIEMICSQFLAKWLQLPFQEKENAQYLLNRIRINHCYGRYEKFVHFLLQVKHRLDAACHPDSIQILFVFLHAIHYQHISYEEACQIVLEQEAKNWEKAIKEIEERQHNSALSIKEVLITLSLGISEDATTGLTKDILQKAINLGDPIDQIKQKLLDERVSLNVLLQFFKPLSFCIDCKTKELWLDQHINEAVAHLTMIWWFSSHLDPKKRIMPHNTQIAVLLLLLLVNDTGALGEVLTGEGKTLIFGMLAAMKALLGYKVHVVSGNRDLAQDGLRKCTPLFEALGLSARCNCSQDEAVNKQAYRAHIVYGDVSSFQRDILQELNDPEIFAGHYSGDFCLLIDEVDSMFLDKGKHILYIAHNSARLKQLESLFIHIWSTAIHLTSQNTDYDFDQQISFLQQLIETGKIDISNDLQAYAKSKLPCWLKSAIEACYMEAKDNFVFDNARDKQRSAENRIVVVDKSTGMWEYGTDWSNGLSQFLQLKYKLRFKEESLKADFISNKHFFCKYGKNIYGLSGTLGSLAAQNFLKYLYPVTIFKLPPARKKRFKQLPGRIATSRQVWLEKLSQEISQQALERPVLVILENIQATDDLMEFLKKQEDCKKFKLIPYAKDEDKIEELFETQPAIPGQIIIATNKGGRGTDIRIDHQKAPAGLHVILSYLPSNSRIEEQAYGRTARAGYPGTGICILKIDPEEYSHELKAFSEKIAAEIIIEKEKISRDNAEQTRINELQKYGLLQLDLEENLYQKYKLLSLELTKKLSSFAANKELQESALLVFKDKWAFWLESIRTDIDAITSPEQVQTLIDKFEQSFATSIRATWSSSQKFQQEFFIHASDNIILGQCYLKNKLYEKSLHYFNIAITKKDRTGYAAIAAAYCYSKCFNHANPVNKKQVRFYIKQAYTAINRYRQECMANHEMVATLLRLPDSKKHIHGLDDCYTEQNLEKLKIVGLHLRKMEQILGTPADPMIFVNASKEMPISAQNSEAIFKEFVQHQVLYHHKPRKKWLKDKTDLIALLNQHLEKVLVNPLVQLLSEQKIISSEFIQNIILYHQEGLWQLLLQAGIFTRTSQVMLIQLEAIEQAIKDTVFDDTHKKSWTDFAKTYMKASPTSYILTSGAPAYKELDCGKFQTLKNYLEEQGFLHHSYRGAINTNTDITDAMLGAYATKQLMGKNGSEISLAAWLNELAVYSLQKKDPYLYQYLLPIDKKEVLVKKIQVFLIEKDILKTGGLEANYKYDKNQALLIQAIKTIVKKLSDSGLLKIDAAKNISLEKYEKHFLERMPHLQGQLRACQHKFELKLLNIYEMQDLPGNIPAETDFFASLYLDHFLTFSELHPLWNWDAFACAMLGLAQIIGGAVLCAVSGGIGIPLGKALVAEGFNDIMYASLSGLTHTFNWKDWLIGKSISLPLAIVTAGLPHALASFNGASKLGGVLRALPMSQTLSKAVINFGLTAATTLVTDKFLMTILSNVLDKIIEKIEYDLLQKISVAMRTQLALIRSQQNSDEQFKIFVKAIKDHLKTVLNSDLELRERFRIGLSGLAKGLQPQLINAVAGSEHLKIINIACKVALISAELYNTLKASVDTHNMATGLVKVISDCVSIETNVQQKSSEEHSRVFSQENEKAFESLLSLVRQHIKQELNEKLRVPFHHSIHNCLKIVSEVALSKISQKVNQSVDKSFRKSKQFHPKLEQNRERVKHTNHSHPPRKVHLHGQSQHGSEMGKRIHHRKPIQAIKHGRSGEVRRHFHNHEGRKNIKSGLDSRRKRSPAREMEHILAKKAKVNNRVINHSLVAIQDALIQDIKRSMQDKQRNLNIKLRSLLIAEHEKSEEISSTFLSKHKKTIETFLAFIIFNKNVAYQTEQLDNSSTRTPNIQPPMEVNAIKKEAHVLISQCLEEWCLEDRMDVVIYYLDKKSEDHTAIQDMLHELKKLFLELEQLEKKEKDKMSQFKFEDILSTVGNQLATIPNSQGFGQLITSLSDSQLSSEERMVKAERMGETGYIVTTTIRGFMDCFKESEKTKQMMVQTLTKTIEQIIINQNKLLAQTDQAEQRVVKLEGLFLEEYKKQGEQIQKQIADLTKRYNEYQTEYHKKLEEANEKHFTNYEKWQKINPNLQDEAIERKVNAQMEPYTKGLESSFQNSKEILLKLIEASKEMSGHFKEVFVALSTVIREEIDQYQSFRQKVVLSSNETIQKAIGVQEVLVKSSQGTLDTIVNRTFDYMSAPKSADPGKEDKSDIKPGSTATIGLFAPKQLADKPANEPAIQGEQKAAPPPGL